LFIFYKENKINIKKSKNINAQKNKIILIFSNLANFKELMKFKFYNLSKNAQ